MGTNARWELCDLAKDKVPWEDVRARQPELAAKMRGALEAWERPVARILNTENSWPNWPGPARGRGPGRT